MAWLKVKNSGTVPWWNRTVCFWTTNITIRSSWVFHNFNDKCLYCLKGRLFFLTQVLHHIKVSFPKVHAFPFHNSCQYLYNMDFLYLSQCFFIWSNNLSQKSPYLSHSAFSKFQISIFTTLVMGKISHSSRFIWITTPSIVDRIFLFRFQYFTICARTFIYFSLKINIAWLVFHVQ